MSQPAEPLVLLPPSAASPCPRRHVPNSRWGKIPADRGRYRPAQASGKRPDSGGHRERGQCPEPDLAVGSRENRQHPIHRAHQCDAYNHRRTQRHSDQIHQRADSIRQRCRAGTRRLGGAAEHRPKRRPPLRLVERHQERQRFDRRSGQRRPQGPPERSRVGAARPEHQRTVRSVETRHRINCRRGPRGRDRFPCRS